MDVEAIDGNMHEEQVGLLQLQLQPNEIKKKKCIMLILLILNCALACIGIAGTLLLRLYYMHVGKRIWLASWLQTAAFPLLLIPLLLSRARTLPQNDSKILLNPKLLIACFVLGLLYGIDTYMMGLGLSYLPASTSSLLTSTSLAFTAVFSFLLVRQKFTFYSINSVISITLGSAILAFHTNGDRPHGVSKGDYFLGFFTTLGGSTLVGLSLPLIELTYSKACMAITYDLVLQMQFVVSLVATLCCTVAMIINKNFQAMTREAREYGLGEEKYYMVITFAAIAMQCSLVANLGVVFCSSALFSGILLTPLVPIQQIFAVILFHEKVTVEKGMSLDLTLWGFASYFYGEYKLTKKQKQASRITQPPSTTGP